MLAKGRQGVLNTNNENKRSVKKKEKGEGKTRGEGEQSLAFHSRLIMQENNGEECHAIHKSPFIKYK